MTQFTPDDLYLHHKLSDLDCVPGLASAVAEVRSVDRDANDYISCIWEFPLDGQPPRQLTRGPGRDKSPRWSGDGKQLAFASNRAGAPQVYILERTGGEARQLTYFDLGVTQLAWAPDSRFVYATAAIGVDPDLRGRRGESPGSRDESAPEVCWRLPYKADGVGYVLAREIHLFRIEVATGETKQITDGPIDINAFAPSPDGKHVAYVRSCEGRYAHRSELWASQADGTKARVISSELALMTQPSWSPDGRWLLFSGASAEGDAQMSLWMFEFSSGDLRPLGPCDLEVADSSHLLWTPDSTAVMVARAWRGRHEIVRVDISTGEARVLVTGERHFGDIGSSGSQLVYSVEAPGQPSELFACELDGKGERQISDLNSWWKERAPIEMESREFNVPDGLGGVETIHGWLLRASGSEGPLPLLDDAHGGPASYALLDFDTNVYWQALCAKGWAVLLLNPVGSSSYGREFCERLAGHWGHYDLPQHIDAVRQLQREGVCDDRVAIAGKSYGGFLASWAIGHTELFRAAVVMAPVGNIETHYGTSDGGYYADPLYVAAAPRFDRGRARELSPLQYIERAKTPTLFLQGKDDERCPKCQSEELFVSLYRAGDTPAELVLYPGEDHHFLGEGKPSTRLDAAERIGEWLSTHAAPR